MLRSAGMCVCVCVQGFMWNVVVVYKGCLWDHSVVTLLLHVVCVCVCLEVILIKLETICKRIKGALMSSHYRQIGSGYLLLTQ